MEILFIYIIRIVIWSAMHQTKVHYTFFVEGK